MSFLSPGSGLFTDSENISGNNFLRPGRNICRLETGLIEGGTNAGACYSGEQPIVDIFRAGTPTAALTFDGKTAGARH